ncbi:GM2 ganglioside activator [Chamberlinius hualienensis]
MKLALLLVALIAAQAQAGKISRDATLHYDNCGGTWNIMLNYLNITPDPLVIPGVVTIDVTVNGVVPVESPAPGKFTFTKIEDDGTETVVPCLDGPIKIGSCDYDDVCSILTFFFPDPNNCPQAFVDAGAPCNCPFVAGEVKVTGVTLDLGTDFAILDSGVYNVKFELFNAAGTQDGCINIGGEIIVN